MILLISYYIRSPYVAVPGQDPVTKAAYLLRRDRQIRAIQLPLRVLFCTYFYFSASSPALSQKRNRSINSHKSQDSEYPEHCSRGKCDRTKASKKTLIGTMDRKDPRCHGPGPQRAHGQHHRRIACRCRPLDNEHDSYGDRRDVPPQTDHRIEPGPRAESQVAQAPEGA